MTVLQQTVLVQHAHDIVSVTQISCFRYEGFVMLALPKMENVDTGFLVNMGTEHVM